MHIIDEIRATYTYIKEEIERISIIAAMLDNNGKRLWRHVQVRDVNLTSDEILEIRESIRRMRSSADRLEKYTERMLQESKSIARERQTQIDIETLRGK